jgi:hypothetical protein
MKIEFKDGRAETLAYDDLGNGFNPVVVDGLLIVIPYPGKPRSYPLVNIKYWETL